MSKEKKKEKKEKGDKKVDPRLEAYHRVLKRQGHIIKKPEVDEQTVAEEKNKEQNEDNTANQKVVEPDKEPKEPKKPKKQSKKKEKKAEAANQDEHAPLPGKQAALEYLQKWHSDRSNWSFKKNKQVSSLTVF